MGEVSDVVGRKVVTRGGWRNRKCLGSLVPTDTLISRRPT